MILSMRTVTYISSISCDGFSATADLQENLATQEAHTTEYITAHGWKKTGTYTDADFSADAGFAFRQMTEDGIRRQFDMVVIDSMEHCGKNISSAEDVLVKTFFQAGIHFAVVADDFCSLGKSAEEVQAYINRKKADFRAKAMHERLFLEQLAGCYAPQDEKYGYVLSADRKELLIDEEAAAVIREIFGMILEDLSYAQIREILNSCKIPSPAAYRGQWEKSEKKEINSNWTDGAVRRIVHCTAYAGYWEKKLGDMTCRIPIAPIVEPDVFEKAQEKCRGCDRKQNRTGIKHSIFSRRIFDAETGKPLFQRNFASGDTAFVINAQVNVLPKSRKKYIPYDEVADTVRQAIAEEILLAGNVMQRLKQGDGAAFLQKALQEYSERATELFEEMSALTEKRIRIYQAYQSGEIAESDYQKQVETIRDELFGYETEMSEMTKRTEYLKTAYSSKNEWLLLFADAVLPEDLGAEEIKKWVTRVEVSNFETVQIMLEKAEWKALFPKEWLVK